MADREQNRQLEQSHEGARQAHLQPAASCDLTGLVTATTPLHLLTRVAAEHQANVNKPGLMSSGIFITTEKEEEKNPQIVITVKIKTRLNDQQVAPKTSRILALARFLPAETTAC